MSPLVCLLLLLAAPRPERYSKLCAQLQKDGWRAQGKKAETNVPGLMYVCMLERALPAHGKGHAPELHALLSDDGDDPSMIFSADVYCAADKAPALDALANTVAEAAAPVPDEIDDAIRAAKRAKADTDDLRYEVSPVRVDAHACTDRSGAVLIKVDVTIKPAAPARQP